MPRVSCRTPPSPILRPVYLSDAAPEGHAFLLELRPHARARRRQRAARWHRSRLSRAAGGRDLFPHAAPPRVRLLRDVALVVRGVARGGGPAFHRDTGV